MSVRFNADEGYTALNAPPGSTWTLVFWALLATDRNAYSTFCSVDDGSEAGLMVLQTDTDGTTPYLYGEPGTVTDASVAALMVGSWYRLAVVRNGTTQIVYRAAATGATASATQTGQSFTATTLRLGQSPTAGEYLDGNLANVKLYSAVLTQTEIETEWGNWQAIRSSGLVRHHKFQVAAETTDYSGNGYSLTTVGSPSFEATNPTIDDSPGAQEAITTVGVEAWATGATSPTIAYPASLATGDRLYMIVHSRPADTAPSGSGLSSWTSLYSASGGSGTDASGAGPTQLSVLDRTAGGTPPSGSTSGTIVTGGNATQGHIRAYRAASGATWSEAVAYYSKTANTNIGGTTTTALHLAGGDVVVVTVGQPDDTNTGLAVTAISATGITFSTLTRSPDAVSTTATGNDLAAVSYTATVTAGSASGTVTVTGTGSTGAETTHVQVLRIRATSSTAIGGVITATLGALTAAVAGTRTTPPGAAEVLTRFGAGEILGLAVGATAAAAAYLGGVRVWGLRPQFTVHLGALTATVVATPPQVQFTVGLGALTATVAGQRGGVVTVGLGPLTATVVGTVAAQFTAALGPLTATVVGTVTAGVTPANPSDMVDLTARSFTASNGQNGNYHKYAAGLPYNQQLGIVFQLHGDGYEEYDEVLSGPANYSITGDEGIHLQAKYRNMICIVARTPDEAGGTWWEKGTVCSVYLRDLINNILTTYPNVSRSKIWLVGYSGGSEQTTLYYLPGYSSSLLGGGALMFGGGGVPDTTDLGATSALKAAFPLKWWVGDIDTGADDEGYDALQDSLDGQTYYAAHGWTTYREVGVGNHSAADERYGAIWGRFYHQVKDPSVASGTATRLTTTSARWTGTVTNAPAVTFRLSSSAFGTQAGSWAIATVDYTARTVSVTVTGLTPGTGYNWRLEIGGNATHGTLLASGTVPSAP